MEADTGAQRRREKWRYVRWGLALGLACLSAILVIGSRFHAGWHVCDSQLTFEGRAVRVCQPYSVGDLVPVLVVIGLLLLPDLSELTLPGGAGLKFRLERQERETGRLESNLDRIEQRLNITATQSQQIFFGIGAAEETLARKAPEFEREQRERGEPATLDRNITAWEYEPSADFRAGQAATASQQLLGIWGQLEPWTIVGGTSAQSAALRRWLATPPSERDNLTLSAREAQIVDRLPTDRALGPDEIATIERWSTVFQDELNSVRLARNAVAHPPHNLGVEEIERAFGVGERLLALLNQGLEAPDSSVQ